MGVNIEHTALDGDLTFVVFNEAELHTDKALKRVTLRLSVPVLDCLVVGLF